MCYETSVFSAPYIYIYIVFYSRREAKSVPCLFLEIMQNFNLLRGFPNTLEARMLQPSQLCKEFTFRHTLLKINSKFKCLARNSLYNCFNGIKYMSYQELLYQWYLYFFSKNYFRFFFFPFLSLHSFLNTFFLSVVL